MLPDGGYFEGFSDGVCLRAECGADAGGDDQRDRRLRVLIAHRFSFMRDFTIYRVAPNYSVKISCKVSV